MNVYIVSIKKFQLSKKDKNINHVSKATRPVSIRCHFCFQGFKHRTQSVMGKTGHQIENKVRESAYLEKDINLLGRD